MDVIPSFCAPPTGATQLRMLGCWSAIRSDSTVVAPRDWRTGKTADLVRILGLAAGQPVPAARLVETLWADARQGRGLASLRTAASQIRQVLGPASLDRSLDGIALRNAWSDVAAFRELAASMRTSARSGDFLTATQHARAADMLYLGDLRAHDDESEWASTVRADLATEYRRLLVDAADAAWACGASNDAVEFATTAIGRDAYCERASRTLMCAYSELGETSAALGEYDRLRALLAEELGTDPSPQTQDIYLSVLRAEPSRRLSQASA